MLFVFLCFVLFLFRFKQFQDFPWVPNSSQSSGLCFPPLPHPLSVPTIISLNQSRPISLHYKDTTLEIALSAHYFSYFNDLFICFLFKTSQASSQDPGDWSEREARTEACRSNTQNWPCFKLECPCSFSPRIPHHELARFSMNRAKCHASFSQSKTILIFPSD